MSKLTTTNELRNQWVAKFKEFLENSGEQVLQTASGTIYIPTLDSEEEERWIKVSVIIPKDATEENGTDGYSLAKEYELKLEEQRKKAEDSERKKQAKIAKDAERRKKKKEE